jgi:putative transcriptional regulator
MICRHPDPDLLVEYAAGTLPLAPSISITTHLAFCERCKNTSYSLREIGGNLFGEAEEQAVSAGLLGHVLESIGTQETLHKEKPPVANDSIAESLPPYIKSLLPEGDLRWRKLSRFVRVAPISVGEDQFELALHRIDNGGQAPHHDHLGREITVVLKGSFSDEDGMYQPGDFIVRVPGESHQPSAARNEECICLSVLEAPIRLTGIKRILNPFITFSPS